MSNKAESNGFSPKNWQYIDCDPQFGSLTNYSDTRLPDLTKPKVNISSGLLTNSLDTGFGNEYDWETDGIDNSESDSAFEEIQNSNLNSVFEETSMGLVEFVSSESEFGLFADEYGVGILYDENGRLKNMAVDFETFFNGVTDVMREKSGGNALYEMFEKMGDLNEMITVNYDFVDKTIIVKKIETDTGKKTTISSNENCPLTSSESSYVVFGYKEYDVYAGFFQKEDEFGFGFCVLNTTTIKENKLYIPTCLLLSELNYSTYLNSESPDKYEKLVRRIFFV